MNKNSWFLIHIMLLLFMLPALACGPSLGSQVTPTPTKTPKIVRTLEPLPSPTPLVIEVELPTNSPAVPVDTPTPVPPADTPTPELPPTDTPTPEPPPTDTPPPPPPATNTPVPPPPPPTNTPGPPPPTSPPPPPPSTGPAVLIDIPTGDEYALNQEVRFNITVTDPDGIRSFTWGVFAQNGSPVGLGGERGCGGALQCDLSDKFDTKLVGIFFLGVDAVDNQGNTTREIKQIYVG